MRIVSVLLAMWAMVLPAFSQAKLPPGWRIVHDSKSSSVQMDLNGDGLIDKAALATDGHNTKAFAFLAQKGGSRVMELMESQEESAKCSLELLPPGRYMTACGKGLVECNGSPEEVVTKVPILSFSDQNVAVIFLFEGSKLQRIWLSD